MKNKKSVVLGILLLGTGVNAEMRAFELTDGRVLEAEVIDYNSRLGTVVLKRADGKRLPPVKPNLFVEKDQDYIREWSKFAAFRSDSVLKIKCDDVTIKKWKKEETKDVRYTDGIVEKDFIVNVIDFEQVAFELEFNNLGASMLKGVNVEYCIYYEQSKMAENVKPEMIQKTFVGKLNIPEIPEKNKIKVTTKPVEVYEDNLNVIPQGGDGDLRRPGDGSVHGMRARLYMQNSSGLKVMREVSSPSTLSEKKYPWKD